MSTDKKTTVDLDVNCKFNEKQTKLMNIPRQLSRNLYVGKDVVWYEIHNHNIRDPALQGNLKYT